MFAGLTAAKQNHFRLSEVSFSPYLAFHYVKPGFYRAGAFRHTHTSDVTKFKMKDTKMSYFE